MAFADGGVVVESRGNLDLETLQMDPFLPD
jgi:hypothetical protein